MVSRKEEGREDGGKKAMQSIQVLHHTLHPDLFCFLNRKKQLDGFISLSQW
jgi:hypothetical protein